MIVATGDEAETELEYGIIDQLVRRSPLDAATRSRPGTAARRRPGVGRGGLLGVIDGLEIAAPVVVVVDDAHWADDESLRALTFAPAACTTTVSCCA